MTPEPDQLAFELSNDLAEMPLLAEHLEQFCLRHGIDGDVLSQLNLALDEIVLHIISYGYGPDRGAQRIRVALAHDGASLTARIEDDAPPFDPLEREDPNLGMHLVKTLVDEVSYTRERERNVLVIRKQT
ncbi:MAG: hypothetical protein A3J29_02750 [Acidobacteria bacterium RIFCSPLOWO2_12_FULL_67_14b]|nr:MAG: hypothetical protein A3J29_02750 [Acidobacteria bacterium RIFCSPLOWO2_12_FULL_67_14b]